MNTKYATKRRYVRDDYDKGTLNRLEYIRDYVEDANNLFKYILDNEDYDITDLSNDIAQIEDYLSIALRKLSNL